MGEGRKDMPGKKQSKEAAGSTELLRDLLITELAKAGVPQLEIRKIVGCDIHKVSRIARHIKQEKEQ
jgi:hypothetical protein